MNEITLRATFGAAAAPGVTLVGQYTEPVRAAGPTLMVQAIGAGAVVTVQGSNLPGVAVAWVDVASVAAGVPEQVECLYGYVRVSASAACEVGISGVAAGGGAGGVASTGLTDTQLRADPLPLPTGAATAAAQGAALARMSRLDSLATCGVYEPVSGGVYVLKTQTETGEGPAWLVKHIAIVGEEMTISYAGPTNNPAQASAAAAWAARASLFYGQPQEA